jgi:hypothetical protein
MISTPFDSLSVIIPIKYGICEIVGVPNPWVGFGINEFKFKFKFRGDLYEEIYKFSFVCFKGKEIPELIGYITCKRVSFFKNFI